MKNFSRPYGLLFLSFSILIMISGAAAQPNSSADQAEKTVIAELDNATWISGVEWNPENRSGVIEVTVHSDIPKPVSIQEIPDYQGKSGSFNPMKQVTLSPGENRIIVSINGDGKLGSGTLGVALTDSNDGVYYRKRNVFFFENITRLDFWLFGGLVAVSVIFQILARSKVSDWLLKRVKRVV